ncbi:STAS domain-containing protein [Bacillus haynesii]|uniref:STAS domain-containing protein n=1 Tax=Bacillus haynesii TaxID=1925021 RepID=UPI00227F4827|nr:STAS domain-containing protein [Bacillus haynesii]MCY8551229.1 STAS domain-containing protein [Bacillus haynesii]MCY8641227.1 STAS domain-containing protein [Bacillus haynesii]
MENKHAALYEHLVKQADRITDEWLSRTASEKEKTAQQYNDFILAVSKVFAKDEQALCWDKASGCAKEIAYDRAVSQIPVIDSIKGFKVCRELLMDEIKQFSDEYQPDSSKKDFFIWNKQLHLIMDEVIEQFILEYEHTTKSQLEAQTEMIRELSAPVIPVSEHIGVLPLIGEIDTHRATVIIESALKQCAELHLSHLFIDISGVPVVDTMVAYQLFKVVDSTKLLGVETVLSGVRPEIAQTVVKLGMDFSHIKTEQSLAKALCNKGFCIHEDGKAGEKV